MRFSNSFVIFLIFSLVAERVSSFSHQPDLWRPDYRCGPKYPLDDGVTPAQCQWSPCCSDFGWCGNSDSHCTCSGCIRYGETEHIRYGPVCSEPGWVTRGTSCYLVGE